jgi:hypothetical protein
MKRIPHMTEPSRKISAKELVADVRAGMDDDGLTEKYQISADKLGIFLKMLVERGSLTRAELNDRAGAHSQNDGDGTQEVPFGSSPEPHDQFRYVAPPPAADVPASEQGEPFDNTRVFPVAFLFGFSNYFCGGIFTPIWFLWKKSKLNRLRGPVKLGEALPTVTLILSIGAWIFGNHLDNLLRESRDVPPNLAICYLIFLVVMIGAMVLMIILAFRARRMLIDHCKATGQQESFSAPLTLFFSIAYLQYKMNRLYVTDEEMGQDMGPVDDTVPRSRYEMVNDDR